MADRSDYLALLTHFGLSEDDVVPLVADRTEELEATLLPLLERALRSAVTRDDRVPDKEAFLARRLEFLRQNVRANANVLVELKRAGLQRRLAGCGVDLPADLFAAVHPWESFNGYALRCRRGYLVLVHNRLLKTAESAAAVLASGLEPSARASALAEVVRISLDRSAPVDPRRFQTPGAPLAWELLELADAVQSWALLHELGHCAHGHPGFALPEERARSSPEAHHARAQEREADDWALASLRALSLGERATRDVFAETWGRDPALDPRATALAGPDLFFGLAVLHETAWERAGANLETHPPALERWRRTHAALADLREKFDHRPGVAFARLLPEAHERLFGEAAPEALRGWVDGL